MNKEKIIKMDELVKYKFRNIVSAIAYFLMAIFGALFVIGDLNQMPFNTTIIIIIEVLIAIAAIILLILKKRDLTALVLLMFSILFGFYTATGGIRFSDLTIILCWFFIIFPILFLFTKEKKVITYFTIFLPYGIGAIIYGFTGESVPIIVFIHIFEACYAFFLGLLYLLEKVKFFLSLRVRSDENIEFTKIGPSLCYYLLAVFSILIPVALITGTIESENFVHISIACGIGLILTSIILWIFAKFRLRAILLFLVGLSLPFVTLEHLHIPGHEFVTFIIIAIILILIALVTLIWKKEVLSSIMYILIGIFYLLFGIGLSNPIISLVILGIACLIGIYLTLACLSKKPIPVI